MVPQDRADRTEGGASEDTPNTNGAEITNSNNTQNNSGNTYNPNEGPQGTSPSKLPPPVRLENRLVERVQPNKTMFNCPKFTLEPLDRKDKQALRIKYGLKVPTLPLPVYAKPKRLKKTDIRNRDTQCVQMFMNDSTKEMKLMNHFIHLVSKVLSVLWHYESDIPRVMNTPLPCLSSQILAYLQEWKRPAS
jgi:hypothetical protein